MDAAALINPCLHHVGTDGKEKEGVGTTDEPFIVARFLVAKNYRRG